MKALWRAYDGTSPRILRIAGQNGWGIQAHVEWSPDATELVMCGVNASTVHLFVTDTNGIIKRQLTSTGGWNCDPSWSPDGSKIVFNRCVLVNCHNTYRSLDIYTINSIDGSWLLQLTTADAKDDYDPYYSPNGFEIAWLHQVNNTGWSGVGVWSIKKMSVQGASQVFLINDTNINSKPSWTLDGSKILFHRMVPAEVTKYRFFSMVSDGTNLVEISPFGSALGGTVGNLSYPMN